MRFLSIVLFFCIAQSSRSQPSDFLILKKKGKSITNFYAGTNIEFVSIYGAYRNGLITQIRNDSVFIQEFQIQQIPTTLGTYITDTVGSFRYAYPYRDILTIGSKPEKGFNLAGSGAALSGGGVLLMVASGVVYIVDKDKFSPELALGAAGLAAVGYLLSKAAGKSIVIGKRGYSLEYADMTP